MFNSHTMPTDRIKSQQAHDEHKHTKNACHVMKITNYLECEEFHFELKECPLKIEYKFQILLRLHTPIVAFFIQ
ncbi:CLUMA_CG017085, isoform A [Clunio marinus]|uniref:CLUMA_CG017085, isoform A n=1 Tax=Clunio marinus TaxID=568069 RepID=A0A1J1IWL9_9DIPT|nr:CLUMA_CG017085, isoform A [Clunio marinus]